MATLVNPMDEFIFYQPLFKEHIKGRELENLADEVGCSSVSLYSYIGGKIPDKSKCKYIVELGINILLSKGVQFEHYKK